MSNMLLEKSRDIAPESKKRLTQSRNNAQLWMCLVVKVKSDAVKNNIVRNHDQSSFLSKGPNHGQISCDQQIKTTSQGLPSRPSG